MVWVLTTKQNQAKGDGDKAIKIHPFQPCIISAQLSHFIGTVNRRCTLKTTLMINSHLIEWIRISYATTMHHSHRQVLQQHNNHHKISNWKNVARLSYHSWTWVVRESANKLSKVKCTINCFKYSLIPFFVCILYANSAAS